MGDYTAPGSWRSRAGTVFECEKRPASGHRGMVVSNHPLASAAGAEMLAAGGNAIDATIAALFALNVVEPMMVGLFGGGMMHIRLAEGRHLVLDGMSTAPAASGPTCYKPASDTWPDYLETVGKENAVGVKSIATPGNLKAWCEALGRWGTFSLADVMEPAIRHASRGFRATPFLNDCVEQGAADMVNDAPIARIFLPGGQPVEEGARVVQAELADTLRAIAKEGPSLLYEGALGRSVSDHLQKSGAFLGFGDLRDYKTIERQPVRGLYRGVEIVGPPPPSSGGIHVIQMLNLLEGYDIAGLGFGSPKTIHLILEALKIAFADRFASTGDPAFVKVPVDTLLSKKYGDMRRAEIDIARAGTHKAKAYATESANTTHLTVADGKGNVVAATQTINSLFGARVMIPGTGIIPNNYMYTFDPHPGQALSIAPGKRIATSMSPIMALKDGKPQFALGLPGGVRIFGSAMQAVLNLVDHGMELQEAVEAPRVWTQGQAVELESKISDSVREGVSAMGHPAGSVASVGGGMCAIRFAADGEMTGSACWRADGTAIGLGGGHAKKGSRFVAEAKRS
ncbi:MAG: gamma-glutamyltransferase [Alphaproteobacteria bacterium]|nr:gamma-glutamyltransferase [Alphaproteobacteria bacterium]